MAMCDGQVRLINFSIDPNLHKQLGHRSDGEPTSMEGISAGKGNRSPSSGCPTFHPVCLHVGQKGLGTRFRKGGIVDR
jgi:hypothetical protein